MSVAIVIREEIYRLEKIIADAVGAEEVVAVLRETLANLERIESARRVAALRTVQEAVPTPLVPRHEPEPVTTIVAKPGTLLAEIIDHAVAEAQALPQNNSDDDDDDYHEPVVAPSLVESSAFTSSGIETRAYTHADTLLPLTKRQLMAFEAVWALHDVRAAITALAVGAEMKDRAGANDTLNALVTKRYIKRLSGTAPARYEPIAKGEPKLLQLAPPQPRPAAKPTGEVESPGAEPAPRRHSAEDKKRALNELNPVTFLVHKGHQCKKATSDLYVLDGKTVRLNALLDKIGIYRTRAGLPPLDLERYL